MTDKPEIDTDGNLAKVLDLAGAARSSEEPKEVIHRVIDQCLLNMVFQPIVDLREGKIFSYEALCRSRVPQFETPPAMIDAAIAVGRVGELGRLQRSLASKNCADWPIFMNISPNEFDEPWLVRPDDAIHLHRQPVYLEITESVPLVFFEQCHSVLAELRRKGAHLAIDDLGAGYSNLKYIADLAPDIVKLDRDLVAGCTMDGSQFELLRSIAKLCHEVNARVVAEGVETAEELEAVSSAGIDLCQGFFLGRPNVTPSELTWPASDMVASDALKARQLARPMDLEDATPEETDRRLEDLETARALLEKSVRKARGEVVRLRKALNRAESRSEQSQTRLADVEDSLEQSERNRRRLAQLFEQATLRNDAHKDELEESPKEEPARKRRVIGQAAVWAAGLLAGLGLYALDPRATTPPSKTEPAAAVAIVSPAPAQAVAQAMPLVVAPADTAETPFPVDAESVTAPAAASGDLAVETLRSTVLSWAQSWSAQEVDGYLSHYSPHFVSDEGASGELWHQQRRSRLTAPGTLSVQLEELEVQLDGPARASARFLQDYRSDNFDDQVWKELHLVQENGRWLILSESVLQ